MELPIFGRTEQKVKLEEAITSSQPEFLALIGRRRVGKTYLIRSTYQKQIDFELVGIKDANKSDQLKNFTYQLQKYFPDTENSAPPKSWLDAFMVLSKALEEKKKKGKLVVFLDELPWMGTKRSGFIQALGWFWNTWGSKNNIVLAVCGSATSWMLEKIINDRGGLHNRINRIIQLHPFTLKETNEYLQFKNVHLAQYQITQLYMVMGGIPMYLNQVDGSLSAIQNIQEICFKDTGYLKDEFHRLFSSLFNNFENHLEIVNILGAKKKGLTRKEIIQQSSFKNGGMLTQILNELEQSGFLGIYSSFGKKKRESLYRLTDPYTLFYLTFVAPMGKGTNIEFTTLSELPKWKSWSGYAFENICFKHIDQIRIGLGIKGIFSSISSFFAVPKDGFPGTQIDLIIDRNDQTINICEIKFAKGLYEVTKRDVDNIQQKKDVFRYHTKTKKHLFTTLITTHGAVQNKHRLNSIDQVLTLEDLLMN